MENIVKINNKLIINKSNQKSEVIILKNMQILQN